MSSKNLKTCLYLLVLMSALIPVGVFGQAYGGFGGNITLTMTPEFPRANEEVTVTAQGFSVDLDRAEVSWYENGVLKKKGVGARSFSFTTGALGEASSLRVVVASPSRGLFRETLAIRPAEVDILSEADSYTPPFYKGKGLPSGESRLRLTALPFLAAGNGRLLNPASLVYSWEQDGKKLLAESGFGKQSATIRGPLLFQESIVSVEVSSLDESLKAKKTIFFDAESPRVLFYEKHPLRGILYERALKEKYTLLTDEFSLRAEPYFFPRLSLPAGTARESALLEFGWSVNSRSVPSQKQNELILRKEAEGRGGSRVELTIKDVRKLLQAAAALVVQF